MRRTPQTSLLRPGAARILAALLLASLAGCSRGTTTGGASGYVSEYSPWTGQDPFTIRGIRPGQSEDEVVALLGPPDRRHDSGYRVVSLQWQRFGDMVVTLGADGKVSDVLGNELTAGGAAVLTHGMSEADVRQVLGRPVKDQGQYQPSGSGVISLGTRRVGTTLWYRRNGASIEVTVREEGLAYLHLTPQDGVRS